MRFDVAILLIDIKLIVSAVRTMSGKNAIFENQASLLRRRCKWANQVKSWQINHSNRHDAMG